MKRTASISQRVLSVLVAVLFLWAAGPDAYGFNPCPHHLPVASSAGDALGKISPTASPRHGDTAPTSHQGHGSEGRCICLSTCHGSATPPTPAPEPPNSVDVHAVAQAPVSNPEPSRVLGSRHSPYELHLPNAPPRSI